MPDFVIRRAMPSQPSVKALLEQSHRLMTSLFPPKANHFLSLQELGAAHIRLFATERHGVTIGCGALADHGDYGEIKSMFVAPEARGSGAGEALLEHLVRQARDLGLDTLRLETGVGLDAAHRLYHRAGFSPCDAFGAYAPDSPFSLYMERSI